jgi:hypothetical protein
MLEDLALKLSYILNADAVAVERTVNDRTQLIVDHPLTPPRLVLSPSVFLCASTMGATAFSPLNIKV